MPYCRRCGAKLPEDARFCPACGTSISETGMKPMETHQTLRVTAKPKVMITNAAPGSVEVRAGAEGEVTVDLDVRRPEDVVCNISQDENMITVRCRSRVCSFFSWPIYVFSGGRRVNILISSPIEADIDVENRIGGVAIAGIKGSFEVNSLTGRINLQNCEGSIKARTRTGSVDLENIKGRVSVINSTGSIRFDGVKPKYENWFRTSTGNIELSLKGEPDLKVEASTRLGRITCSPELTDARYEHGRYTGRIGAGTGKLIAETKTGNIRINR